MQETLPQHTIVLLGVGHTNAHIVRMWRMNPLPDVQLICVSDFGTTTYSGMLPGTLAGQYDPAQMQIDLVRLCAASRVRLIRDKVVGLAAEQQQLLFSDRPPLKYDVLSIGIGSRPTVVSESPIAMPIKPMQTFLARLDARFAQLVERVVDRPWKIMVAGAGAAGIEIVLCLEQHIAKKYSAEQAQLTLLDRGDEILSGMPQRTRLLATRELQQRGVELALKQDIKSVDDSGRITTSDGTIFDTDLLLWATSASSPPILSRLGLPTDDAGFLLTRDTLQSTGSDAVFAVGDAGTCENLRRPKAGVFAVRQGPILWKNIQRRLRRKTTIDWQPQRSFLTLLNTGDGRAILTYKGFSVHARWCWKLKDRIDRRFMAKYHDYTPRMMEMTTSRIESDEPIYCGGCGCKIEADLLSRVLSQLDNPAGPHVLVGLDQPDDVAVLQNSAGSAVAASTDFFTAFLDDPYLLGRISALNALSDMFAKGAKSLGALALVTLPHGPAHQQEELLLQLLAGSLCELRPAGVPLVGGHTIEGAQTTIGFTILGEIDDNRIATKGALQAGDQLVLTKPLGAGALLAAHMRALCRAEWMDSLLESLLASNQPAAAVANELQIRAVTDVTGFGLAGHLMEMLCASNASAELKLESLPLLPGAAEVLAQGVESTLTPGNRAIESKLECSEIGRNDPRYAALFDPQTSGGLLMGVPQNQLSLLLERLVGAAWTIGRVIPPAKVHPTIHVS